MEVDSERTGLKVPSGQNAAIVVRRDDRRSLVFVVSSVAAMAAASGSGAAWLGTTVIPLVASLVSAVHAWNLPPGKNWV